MACRVKIFRNFKKNVSWISSGNLLEIGQAVFVDTVNLHRKTETYTLPSQRTNFPMQLTRGVARSKYVGWTHMASVEHEPIMVVWGWSPQRGPKAEPLVRGSEGAKSP